MIWKVMASRAEFHLSFEFNTSLERSKQRLLQESCQGTFRMRDCRFYVRGSREAVAIKVSAIDAAMRLIRLPQTIPNLLCDLQNRSRRTLLACRLHTIAVIQGNPNMVAKLLWPRTSVD